MAVNWKAVAEAESHPTRIAILEQAGLQWRVSPKMLTEAIEGSASLPSVAYHVRALADRGLLVEADQKARRGAVEHYYTLAESARTRRKPRRR